MTKVRVSVCIPAYRQPDHIRRALESVLRQTGVSFEVVITDDTPDDAVQRVVAGCDEDPCVRYFRNPVRLGSPGHWNEAVRLAKGEYIKVLHHDDYLTETDSLRKYVALLDDHPESDLAFSASLVWMVDTDERWVHRPTAGQLRELAIRPQRLFGGNIIGSPSAVIYRRTVTQLFDPRLIWLADVDFSHAPAACMPPPPKRSCERPPLPATTEVFDVTGMHLLTLAPVIWPGDWLSWLGGWMPSIFQST